MVPDNLESGCTGRPSGISRGAHTGGTDGAAECHRLEGCLWAQRDALGMVPETEVSGCPWRLRGDSRSEGKPEAVGRRLGAPASSPCGFLVGPTRRSRRPGTRCQRVMANHKSYCPLRPGGDFRRGKNGPRVVMGLLWDICCPCGGCQKSPGHQLALCCWPL